MPALSRVFTTALLAGLLAAFALLLPGTAAAGTPSFLVADVSHGVTVHASPGGRAILRLSGRTPLGSPRVLWVLDRRRDGRWGRVVLPTRPNGRTGWIRLRPGQIHRVRLKVEATGEGDVVTRANVAWQDKVAAKSTSRIHVTGSRGRTPRTPGR